MTMTRRIFCTAVVYFALLGCISSGDLIVRDQDDDEVADRARSKGQLFNFASQAAGAVVLDKSPAAKGYHNQIGRAHV